MSSTSSITLTVKEEKHLAMTQLCFSISQLGTLYFYSDHDKTKSRDRYIIVSIDGNWCYICKFTGSQLRVSSYKVKLSAIMYELIGLTLSLYKYMKIQWTNPVMKRCKLDKMYVLFCAVSLLTIRHVCHLYYYFLIYSMYIHLH